MSTHSSIFEGGGGGVVEGGGGGVAVVGCGEGCVSYVGNVFISSVFSLSLMFLFLPCPSLLSPLLYLLSLFTLSLGDNTK